MRPRYGRAFDNNESFAFHRTSKKPRKGVFFSGHLRQFNSSSRGSEPVLVLPVNYFHERAIRNYLI